MKRKINTIGGSVAYALGKGLISGAAGTAAITLSQAIEMKLTKREPSTVPADAASKVLDVKPVDQEHKKKMAEEVHWAYGTTWGIGRGILDLAGAKGLPASMIHFASIWATAMVMQPALGVAPPVSEWKPKTIATGGIHHLVYSLVVGWVYDTIDKK